MGTKTISYTPTGGVCSRNIEIEIEDDIVVSIKFIGGCSGNTQGIAALAAGMPIAKVISTLKGIDCKGKGTSCPDQLARALSNISN